MERRDEGREPIASRSTPPAAYQPPTMGRSGWHPEVNSTGATMKPPTREITTIVMIAR